MSTYVPAALRRRIRARFVDRCAYCRTAEALIAAIFEIEHIIPRSAGWGNWLRQSGPLVCGRGRFALYFYGLKHFPKLPRKLRRFKALIAML